MNRTKYKGSKEEVRALNSYVKLMRAAESVTDRIQRHLSRTKLTTSQFGVLEALYHLGPMTQRELGEKILKTSGNMTMVIDNLEKRGLANRIRNEEDRRFFIVNLTEKGRKLIGSIFPELAELIKVEMGVLTATGQEELSRLCKKIGLKGKVGK